MGCCNGIFRIPLNDMESNGNVAELDISLENQDIRETQESASQDYDYAFVPNIACIAVYDDMKMPPRIIEIQPAPTTDYIEHLASCINNEKTKLGGKIPYSAIREVSENFIHAQFSEIVVSILDNGNTIRFCDQGPGIENKEKATLPGYTSATMEMKKYIRGVGSGLPLVKEFLDFSGGRIIIEDNVRGGSVVTITLAPEENAIQNQNQQEPSYATETALLYNTAQQAYAMPAPQTAGVPQNAWAAQFPNQSSVYQQAMPTATSAYSIQQAACMPNNMQTQQGAYPLSQPWSASTANPALLQVQNQISPLPLLNERENTVLTLLGSRGPLGVKEINELTGIPNSSTHALLKKMEERGLIEMGISKKRQLTQFGIGIYRQISLNN